uniref:BZIP domain-containing protein n=1 Tax=Salix viminalis TaxID=40686 RepID=A0A6N2K7F0_SALVM
MNGAGDQSAIFDSCTWPVSAMNKPAWATGKLVQSFSPASSLHDHVMDVKTSHLNPDHQPVTINRNESDQLALEKLAQELSATTPSLLPPLTTLSLNEIVEISHQRFGQNPLVSGRARRESELALEKLAEELSTTATSMVPQMSLSSIVDQENIIEIENPQTLAPYIYSVLQAKLNMACAAAAIRFGEPSTHPKNQVQAEQNLEPSPEYKIDAMQRKRKVEMRQTISDASSKEDSEAIEEIDRVEAKRARRLVVNRNSARSYRRRRQSQITELQAEIDNLMDEHASMASDFARVQKKHADAIAENEKLKDEIGALTARLSKVEERVEQLVKVNPMFILNFRKHGRGVQHGGSQVNQASSNAEFNMDPRSIQQLQPDRS